MTVYTCLNQLIDYTPYPTQLPSVFYSSLVIALVQRENKSDWLDYIESFIDNAINLYSTNLYGNSLFLYP